MNPLSLFCQKYLSCFEYMNPSFAQEGEDLILSDLFAGRNDGFYVDVGAHHPKRFSNTYLFYRRGWRGLNIDPLISLSTAFARQRPRDVNLGIGIAPVTGELEYFEFNEPALNTFSKQRRDFLVAEHGSAYHLTGSKKIPTRPLREILAQHLPPGQKIDFLSVDVEGLDEAVLSSNDWGRFRPSVVLVEDNSETNSKEPSASPVTRFLADVDYVFLARTNRTLIFGDKVRAAP